MAVLGGVGGCDRESCLWERERSRKRGFSILCEEWVLPRKDKEKKKKKKKRRVWDTKCASAQKIKKKAKESGGKKREVGVRECGTRSDEEKEINK